MAEMRSRGGRRGQRVEDEFWPVAMESEARLINPEGDARSGNKKTDDPWLLHNLLPKHFVLLPLLSDLPLSKAHTRPFSGPSSLIPGRPHSLLLSPDCQLSHPDSRQAGGIHGNRMLLYQLALYQLALPDMEP